MKTLHYYSLVQLMRLHRPIGWLLLLWPTLLALWGASEGQPSWSLVIIFSVGVVVMRSAGCVINDWADRDFDGFVARTKERPMATKKVTSKAAWGLFVGLLFIALLLVSMTNRLTMMLSVGGLVLASAYPFMKRYTHFPQVVLGAAYAWGIPMAYAAQSNEVPFAAYWLYAATLLWTVAFDTIYAIVDKEDDLKIGVKSSAIAFGRYDKLAIGILQVASIACFAIWGTLSGLSFYFAIGCIMASGLFLYQHYLIRERLPERCFKAFLNNQWVGLALFLGAVLK